MLYKIKSLSLSFALSALLGATNLFGDGQLSLVSSGTGDLDNMTLKAHKLILEADIVFTMNGKAGKFESLIKDKPIYPSGHALFSTNTKGKWIKTKDISGKVITKTPQEIKKIEADYKKMIRKNIKEGKNIVIIDNGDPAIYGPHIYFIKEFQDLKPKIIPGISSFNAANAALQTSIIGGINNAKGVTLTIGNTKNKLINYLASSQSTMVFFMDREFNMFIPHLLTLYPKQTPIAIVINAGDSEKEDVIIATLETIQDKIGKEKIPFNHLVYVGNFI